MNSLAISLLARYTCQRTKLRSRQKKLKAHELSSLTEFLPELKPPRQSKPASEFKLNSKSRQKLMRADPLGSIHQHSQSTQPVAEEKPKKLKASAASQSTLEVQGPSHKRVIAFKFK
uniref:Uncharacterized protein n=1 Tax=Salix viminalis TaxID=40686 RepID=A0A6N2KF30_SALVM